MSSFRQTTLATRGRLAFAHFERSSSLIAQHSDDQICNNFASIIRDQAQRFKIWAVDLGLLVPGHGSLDYRVREAETLQRTLATYLDDLARDLQELVTIVSFPTLMEYERQISEQRDARSGDDNSSSDDGMQHADYVAISIDSVTDVIDQLFKLSTRIRDPTTRLISTKARAFRAVDEDSGRDLVKSFQHWDYCHVHALFTTQLLGAPMEHLQDARRFYASQTTQEDNWWHSDDTCDLCRSRQEVHGRNSVFETASQKSSSSSDFDPPAVDIFTEFLVQRLAKANTHRQQQFMYWKSHHGKQVERTQSALDPQLNEHSHWRVDLASPESKDAAVTASNPALIGLMDPIVPTITTATRLNPANLLVQPAQSIASVSEYAPSNYESGAEVYDFPPPPKVGTGDKFFTCPYCFTVCSSRLLSERAWKAHLIHDLRPYTCTYPNCKSAEQLYDSRADWIAHENSAHRKHWRCLDHQATLFQSKEELLQHLTSHHPEDLELMSSEQYLRSCETISENSDRPCPICFSSPENAASLNKHIALHLERVALFALPRSRDGDEDDEAEANSVVAVDARQYSRASSSGSETPLEEDWEVMQRLHAAARENDVETLNFMLREHGDRLDDEQEPVLREVWKAMRIACEKGHKDFIEALLEQRPTLFNSRKYDHLESLYSRTWYKIYDDAIIAGQVDMVQALIRHADAAHAAGQALVSAAYHEDRDLVEYILDYGIDVNSIGIMHDLRPGTALHATIPRKRKTLDITRLLIDRGADIEKVVEGWSPLQEAARYGDLAVLQQLLNAGADIASPNARQSPLAQASDEDREKMVVHLLNINYFEQEYVSEALLSAIRRGHLGIVKVLVSHGADVNYDPSPSDGDYKKPLALALAEQHKAVSDFLVEKGATTARIRDPNTTKLQETQPVPHPNFSLNLVHDIQCSDTVTCIGISRDGQLIITGLFSRARLLNTRNAAVISQIYTPTYFPGSFGPVLAAEFSADSERVYLGGPGKSLAAYDVHSGNLLVSGRESLGPHTSIRVSPDGKLIVSVAANRAVHSFDSRTLARETSYQLPDKALDARFSPDGSYIAVISEDSTIYVFDVYSGACCGTHHTGLSGVHRLAFEPTGNSIYGVLDDRTIKAWTLHRTQGTIKVYGSDTGLINLNGIVSSMKFLAQTPLVAVALHNRTVDIWDASNPGSYLPLLAIKGWRENVRAIASSTSAPLLATVSDDHTLTVWTYDFSGGEETIASDPTG